MATALKHQESEQLSIEIPDGARKLKIQYIHRLLIDPDPAQPRALPDAELRASIARNGILQAITVRPHPDPVLGPGRYMIVDGERRWRGAEGVLEELPVVVRRDQEDGARRLITQLVANTGKALTPLEEARAYGKILQETGMSVSALAQIAGVPRSTMGERLALLELGPWLPLVERGEISISQAARALLPVRMVPDKYHEIAIANVQKDWRFQNRGRGEMSVVDFERLIEQVYRPFMYPLAKTKSTYEKQPEFPTAKHDSECGCGRVKWAVGSSGKRVCCANPDWWKPLHRKALAAKKAAEPKKASVPKGKRLYLPNGVQTVKSQWGDLPKGVVALTDRAGRWRTSPHQHDSQPRFDPADLGALDPAKLVVIASSYTNDYPVVGTKDTAAVRRAEEAWRIRFSERAAFHEGEVLKELEAHRAQFTVFGNDSNGDGIQKLMETIARHHGEDLVDLASAVGIDLGDAVRKADRHQLNGKVAAAMKLLTVEEMAELATAFATAAGRDLKLTAERVREEEAAALVAIAKRKLPWLTAPKESKGKQSAAKQPVAKKSTAKKGATALPVFREHQPSPELAAVVGSKPQPRTEVTKRLWDYIRKHGLQDKRERRKINADDALRPVFGGKASVSMFEMTKLVNKHLTEVESAVPTKKSRATKQIDQVPASVQSAVAFADELMAAAATDDEGDEDEEGWTTHRDESDDLWDSAEDEDEDEESGDAWDGEDDDA